MIPLLARRPPGPSLVLDMLSGVLDNRIAFSRASSAYYWDASGTLQQAGNNVPRFDYDPATGKPQGLLVEPACTNAIRNPRAEGGTTGTPGTLPTNWTRGANTSGLAQTFLGTFTVNGVPVWRIRFTGTTPGSATAEAFEFDARTANPCSAFSTWTGSTFVRLVAGDLSGLSALQLRWIGSNSGGSALGPDIALSSDLKAQVGSSLTRLAFTRTGVDAGLAYVILGITLSFAASATVDFTLDIGAPQFEQGAAATSVVLPPVGTPAAATRALEQATMSNPAPAVVPSAGAIVLDFAYPYQDSVGLGLVQLDNGSAADAIRVIPTGPTPRFVAAVGGVNSWNRLAATNFGAGRNTLAIGWGSGNGRMSVNGGAATLDSGALPAACNTLRIGGATTGPMNGWMRRLRAWNVELPAQRLIDEQAL